ncbi:MAG: DUF839 domain-containing protein [Planctomycetaceae bacterium]
MSSPPRLKRRDFLRLSAATVAVGTTFDALNARICRGDVTGLKSEGYGPLRPVADEITGMELLQLPEGFRYLSFGWTGEPMADGMPTPHTHDGMAVTSDKDGKIILTRNHEIAETGRPLGPPEITYDAKATGGCTNLLFDSLSEKWIKSWPSIAGTVRNCAGGPTPWGTWLTAEETTLGPGDEYDGKTFDYEQTHGWVFEVQPDGKSDPRPIKGLGRIWHEAVAIDPETGIVYETEDRKEAGLYRFVPDAPGDLRVGGRLQMLKAVGRADLRKGLSVGQKFDVQWVDIDDPERADSPGTHDHQGVYRQGVQGGGSTFARLEGAWYGNKRIYVTATSGGDAERGQVWEYNPQEEVLTLKFESPGMDVLDMPDNMCVSPRGGIVLCEDGDIVPQRLHGLTADGRLFTLAANNIDFRNGGAPYGIPAKDYRAEEWAGATFSFDGKWLFVNIQTPGVTFAITGPWGEGLA